MFDAVGQAALTLPYAGGCAAATAFNPKEHLSGTPDCLCHPLKKSWHKHVCVCVSLCLVERRSLQSICPRFPTMQHGGRLDSEGRLGQA